MQYIGTIHGAAGESLCFGYAYDPQTDWPIYLELAGPKSAVESVWGILTTSIKPTLAITNLAAKTHYMIKQGKQTFTRYQREITTGLEHLILIDRRAIDPDGAITFIPVEDTDNTENAAKHVLARVASIVNIPVFDEWADYLWTRGISKGYLRQCKSTPGTRLTLYSLGLTELGWTALIATGLKNKSIKLPL